MKLAISNIAWEYKDNEEIFAFLSENKFAGIEVAPTKIIVDNPYEHCAEAKKIVQTLVEKYGLLVCSMQSIWFGVEGNIFESNDVERLIEYTKRAIIFAEYLNCPNLVFGCPKNRNVPNGKHINEADYFFKEISKFANEHDTCIALEPNPVIYNTNFINTTEEAFAYVRHLNIEGLRVNVDFGTIIANDEDLGVLEDNMDIINHIHISEPYLEIIKKRGLHEDLRYILEKGNYNKYVSIEMKNNHDIETVKDTIEYISEVFL